MQRRTKLGFGAALAATMLVLTASTSSVAQPEPERSFVLQIELEGVTLAQWNQCVGIGDATQVIEQEVTTPGGEEVVRKVPGRHRQHDIVCSRAIGEDLTLVEWREQVHSGSADARKDGSIVLFDFELAEFARFPFTNAWPSELLYVPNATGGFDEVVTIVVETLERTR